MQITEHKPKDPAFPDVMEHIVSLENVFENKSQLMAYYYILNSLANLPRGQSPHIETKEADFIKGLREQKFSVGEIAFIVDRSKSTIHELLTK